METRIVEPRVQGAKVILELCADLASVKSLSSLTEGQRLVFRERLAEAAQKAWRSELPSDDAALSRLHHWLQRVVIPLVNLPRVAITDRRLAKRRAILLEGLSPEDRQDAPEIAPTGKYEGTLLSELGAPRLSRFLTDARGKRDWRVVVRPLSGQVAIEEDGVAIERGLEDLAWHLVQPGAVFPFARCKNCQRVFVLTKWSQLYCSPTCAAESNKENRRAKVRENVRRFRESRKKGGT